MRKILYVITKSNWGGAQRYVFDLATSLPKDEFKTQVALGGNGILKEKLVSSDVRTISIKSLQRNVSIGADIQSFFELRNIFKSERPDVVHLNSSKAGGVGALAARFAGVPKIIFTAHGWPFWEQRGALSRAAIWFFSWLTALLSHGVICVSEYDLRVARHMPFIKKRAVRIYNGIAQPMTLGSGEKIRSAFPMSAKITGTIGELNKNKNQRALIEEARHTPNMYVEIVGEGEEREMLKVLIQKYELNGRVKLFGFMPASDALPGFDSFALPSLKEGFPYVLLEAKLAGLPISANRIGGVGEILDTPVSEFTLERMVRETAALY